MNAIQWNYKHVTNIHKLHLVNLLFCSHSVNGRRFFPLPPAQMLLYCFLLLLLSMHRLHIMQVLCRLSFGWKCNTKRLLATNTYHFQYKHLMICSYCCWFFFLFSDSLLLFCRSTRSCSISLSLSMKCTLKRLCVIWIENKQIHNYSAHKSHFILMFGYFDKPISLTRLTTFISSEYLSR